MNRLVSAAVFAVLVMLWAAVLVPMWLRRHDKANELAGADRFALAMRVLSRRRVGGRATGPPGHRYVLMPSRPASARMPQVSAPAMRRPRPARKPARQQAVNTRRRGLVIILLALLLSVVLAVSWGGPYLAIQGLTDVLAAAGLAQLRASTLAERHRQQHVSRRPPDVVSVARTPLRREALSTPVAVDASHLLARAVGDGMEPTPGRLPTVVHPRPTRKIVFDSERPEEAADVHSVARPTTGPPAHGAARPPRRRDAPARSEDWREATTAPSAPERVPVDGPLLDDEVELPAIDGGVDLLDDILGRAVNE